MTGPVHGSYNGWCRVEGIPLKAEDCPACVEASKICPHGDLLASCLDCSIAPPKPKARPRPVALKTATAQFDSNCEAFPWEHNINQGDTIGLVDIDGTIRRGWVCSECFS